MQEHNTNIYIYIYIYTHTHTHIYIHTYIHTRTHTYPRTFAIVHRTHFDTVRQRESPARIHTHSLQAMLIGGKNEAIKMVTRVAGTKKPRKPSPRPSAQASAAALSNSSRAGAPDLDRLGERHKRTTHPPSGSHGLQPSRSAANLLRREHTYSGDSSPHNTTTPLRHALGEAVEAAGHAVGGSGAGSSSRMARVGCSDGMVFGGEGSPLPPAMNFLTEPAIEIVGRGTSIHQRGIGRSTSLRDAMRWVGAKGRSLSPNRCTDMCVCMHAHMCGSRHTCMIVCLHICTCAPTAQQAQDWGHWNGGCGRGQ